MTQKEKDITKRITARIKEKNPDAEVILFGSHARGESHKDSDWDILILLDLPFVSRSIEREYRDELFDLELELGEPLSVFVMSKSEWEGKYYETPLYRNIKKEGIYI